MTVVKLDVLFVNGKIYKYGDQITVFLSSGKAFTGKIKRIYDEDITLDCSKEFESIVKEIRFEDIKSIESQNGVKVDWLKNI